MIIDCIGCLHGAKPELNGGDLLIVTGDLTAGDTLLQHSDALDWINKQKYEHKIVIAGNHDNFLQKNPNFYSKTKIKYLCDSETEIAYYPKLADMEEGKSYFRKKLKVWGSPWTSQFEGINPHCCAFTGINDEEISPKFELIPSDVDILVTHSPPWTIRDRIESGLQVGSIGLLANHISRLRPRLWAFSHIHEGYGQDGPYHWSGTRYVNCSIMNERYQPVNAPIRIILSDKDFPGSS